MLHGADTLMLAYQTSLLSVWFAVLGLSVLILFCYPAILYSAIQLCAEKRMCNDLLLNLKVCCKCIIHVWCTGAGYELGEKFSRCSVL